VCAHVLMCMCVPVNACMYFCMYHLHTEYIHTCACIHTYIYIYIYTHTYKQTNIHTYTSEPSTNGACVGSMYACHTYAYIHTYIHTHTRAYIHAYTHQNQTVHQPGMFGQYVRWSKDVPCPSDCVPAHVMSELTHVYMCLYVYVCSQKMFHAPRTACLLML
jgi:hypothetical protein